MTRTFTIALLLLLATPTMVLAGEAEELATDTPLPVEGAAPPPLDPQATPIMADPTVDDPRSHPWERIVVHEDGRTLDVYFWMGAEECNGLHSVVASPTPTGFGIDIRLRTGQPARMEPGTVCIAIAQQYVTRVSLVEPLITQRER